MLKSVIHADVKSVVDNGISPMHLARMKGLSSRAIARSEDINSPEHIAVSNKLIEKAQQDVIKKYLDIRHVAIRTEAEQIYREAGKVGVAKYADSFLDDNDAKTCLRTFLADATHQ